jgi:hypothetical protein
MTMRAKLVSRILSPDNIDMNENMQMHWIGLRQLIVQNKTDAIQTFI